MSTVEFYFDFASPNAYMAYHALPDILSRTNADMIIKPVLLGGIFKATNNQAPFVAFGNIKGKIAYDMLEMQRFIAKYDLTKFQMNQHFPMNTIHMMRGAVVAEEEGFLAEYIDPVLTAMWEESKKMDEPEVIAEVLKSAGLDADHIIARTQDPEIKQKLITKTEEAVERGAFGIPTFFVGDEMWFGKERLGQIEEYLLNG